MKVLAQRYPKDGEAQLHYALTLNTSASPSRIAAPIAAIGPIEGSPGRQPSRRHPDVPFPDFGTCAGANLPLTHADGPASLTVASALTSTHIKGFHRCRDVDRPDNDCCLSERHHQGGSARGVRLRVGLRSMREGNS